MYTLIIDHVSRLTAGSTNPDIMALLTRIQAYKDRFVTAWENWMNAKGHWQGETQRFERENDGVDRFKSQAVGCHGAWRASRRQLRLQNHFPRPPAASAMEPTKAGFRAWVRLQKRLATMVFYQH